MIVCVLSLLLMGWMPLQDQTSDRRIVGIAEWEEPPATFEAFADISDAILLVRIKGHKPWKPEQDVRTPPYTRYSAELLETVKLHPELTASPGADLTFLQLAGEVKQARGIVRSSDPLSLRPGQEAIVFLRWTPGFGEFQLKSGPHGVYILSGGRVNSAAKSSLARRGEAMTPDGLLATIRAAVNRKR